MKKTVKFHYESMKEDYNRLMSAMSKFSERGLEVGSIICTGEDAGYIQKINRKYLLEGLKGKISDRMDVLIDKLRKKLEESSRKPDVFPDIIKVSGKAKEGSITLIDRQ